MYIGAQLHFMYISRAKPCQIGKPSQSSSSSSSSSSSTSPSQSSSSSLLYPSPSPSQSISIIIIIKNHSLGIRPWGEKLNLLSSSSFSSLFCHHHHHHHLCHHHHHHLAIKSCICQWAAVVVGHNSQRHKLWQPFVFSSGYCLQHNTPDIIITTNLTQIQVRTALSPIQHP